MQEEKLNQVQKAMFWTTRSLQILQNFWRRIDPPTLFFNPQDVASLVTSDSKVKVEPKKEKDYEQWTFTMDLPNHDPYHKHALDLYRGNWRSQPEPYLIIVFSPAEYDGKNIIFRPHLRNVTNAIPSNEIDKRPQVHSHHQEEETVFMNFLGLKEHTVRQALDFRVGKEQRSARVRDENDPKKTKLREWFIYPVTISLNKD